METDLRTPQPPVATPAPHIKDTLHAFVQFLKKPEQLAPTNQPLAQVWLPLGQLFLIKFVLALGTGALLYGFTLLLGIDPFANHKVERFIQENHIALVLAMVAVAGPVIEEFFFRLPLVFSSRRLLVVCLAILFLVLPPLLAFTGMSSWLKVVLWITGLMGTIALVNSDTGTEWMEQIWQRHYGAVFYTFAATFALIHLANFENLHLPVALIPLLVIPQFIGGLFWGYIRLRYSLAWAMVCHGLFNGILVCLSYWSLV